MTRRSAPPMPRSGWMKVIVFFFGVDAFLLDRWGMIVLGLLIDIIGGFFTFCAKNFIAVEARIIYKNYMYLLIKMDLGEHFVIRTS